MLPEEFLAKMQTLLQDEYEEYVRCFDGERHWGLRVNTLRCAPQEFERRAPFPVTPVPWIPNGFYYDGESERPARHPYYYAGLYYLQEPSAMTPAQLLGVKPGERVLDLCAAPGGKSTELGACLEGQGLLFSNDISNTRAKALLKNLELFGVKNICVSSETPKRLLAAFPEYFDRILVDAPCSGEGMFRKDADMVKSWTERGPEYYVPIQREILLDAADMLRPGGRMLYSTCTFDREENEGNVEWLLKERPELHLAELPEDLYAGFSGGIGLAGCVRLFPHRLKGEGQFIAVLEKDGNERNEAAARTAAGKRLPSAGRKGKLDLENFPEAADFLSRISWDWDPGRIMAKNDALYYLPEGFPEPAAVRTGVRYLRTGLLLGTVKKGRFEPSQALAMALKPEEFDQVFNLSLDDGRVIRYLKGETIAADAPAKGWYFVCVDGFPLGFAKGNGATLKNKYYPGWRWQ